MRNRLAAASLIVLSAVSNASGHRLDEYLQATTISLEKDRIEAQLRLTPGVAVFSFVIASIDKDRNGIISTREQRAYAERVLGDLSLELDGERLKLQLVSASFPEITPLREGLGDIRIDFGADLDSDSARRKLVFKNRHQSPIAAYLVNCLAPTESDIQIMAQHRNYEQSRYELDYVQSGSKPPALSVSWVLGSAGWFAFVAIFLLIVVRNSRRQRMENWNGT